VTAPSYTSLALVARMGGILLIATFVIAFCEYKKKKSYKKFVLPILIFFIEILWYLAAGRSTDVVIIILCPLFAYIWVNRKVPTKTLVLAAILLFFIIIPLREYRYHLRSNEFYVDKIRMDTLIDALSEEIKQINMIKIASTVDRFYEGKALAYLLLHYSNDYSFEYGERYKNIFVFFIPRIIWPEKPPLQKHFTDYYKLIAGGMIPITFLGDSYINFSWFGIILLSFSLGLLMKGYDSIFIKHANNSIWSYFYIYSAIWILRTVPLHAIISSIYFLTIILIFAFIFGSFYAAVILAVINTKNYGKCKNEK
jgi:oligosaccharide repeat unit polymerase